MEEESSNSSDYDYEGGGETKPVPESDWWWINHLPELVWTVMWLVLFIISLTANLITVVTIVRHRTLHSGYFMLHIFLSTVHIVYFLLSFLHRAAYTLVQFNLLDKFIPYDSLVPMLDIIGSVDDLNQSLLGLEIFLLCAMTVDCSLTLSRKYQFRPKCQGIIRGAMGLIALLLFGAALSVMILLRFTDTLKSGHPIDDEMWPILIRIGIQLGLFICFPVFIVVITGVVNCVTHRNSTRQLPQADHLAQQLDFRHCVAATLLLFFWMAERIITMAVEIEAYEDDQVAMSALLYSRYGLGYAVSLLASVIPLSTLCIFGRLSCCCETKSAKHDF